MSILQRARNAWNNLVNRFRGPVDRVPKPKAGAFGRYVVQYRRNVQSLADQLADGSLGVFEWRNRMRKELRNLHFTAYAAGAGGLDNLTAEDVRRIQQKIADQEAYLEDWAGQLAVQAADGTEVSRQAVVRRAMLYAGNGNSTYYEGAQAAIGMPPLPQYPGDGQTECRTNCKCTLRITKLAGNGNFDVTWVLATAEHCVDCVRLAADWNPLQIRNGVIV